MKIRELFLVLFYDVHKENMFTINLEDKREAPSKACILNIFQGQWIFLLKPSQKFYT